MSYNLGKTLLIIGAGAHVPYLMPTSKEITSLLRKMYKHRPFGIHRLSMADSAEQLQHDICKIIQELKLIPPEEGSIYKQQWNQRVGEVYHEFLRSFCESGVSSIDAYLSNLHKETDLKKREQYANLGKLTIAVIISKYENQTRFGSHDDDWIEYLINSFIRPDIDAFFKSPPSFITFNYDRFLERRLYGHFVEYHKIKSEEAIALIEKLNIMHVYGDLGPFMNWHVLDNKKFFGESISRIKVIGEDRSQEKIDMISDIISNRIDYAQKIYFLGYGFDSMNNKIIMHKKGMGWNQRKDIFSTSIGIDSKTMNSVKKEFYGIQPFGVRRHTTNVVQRDCLSLLRDHSSFGN